MERHSSEEVPKLTLLRLIAGYFLLTPIVIAGLLHYRLITVSSPAVPGVDLYFWLGIGAACAGPMFRAMMLNLQPGMAKTEKPSLAAYSFATIIGLVVAEAGATLALVYAIQGGDLPWAYLLLLVAALCLIICFPKESQVGERK